MSRPNATSIPDVPPLSKERIQEETALLLAEHADRTGRPTAVPIPIEDILEFHLGLTFEIANLNAVFNVADVLGALWIYEKTVRVDSSLDPIDNPKKLGRFRFTLAHEAGHWRLHRQYFIDNPEQFKLYGNDGKSVCVCRSSEGLKAIEWQANYFAAHLLMPGNILRDAWEQWRGGQVVVCLEDLWHEFSEDEIRNEIAQRSDAHRADHHTAENAVMEMFVRPLAAQFEVSSEAMRIRLEEAGFLLRQRSQLLS